MLSCSMFNAILSYTIFGNTYTKILFFIWNSNITRHPIVLFAKSANSNCKWGKRLYIWESKRSSLLVVKHFLKHSVA